MKRARIIPGASRAMTMIEILVALGILAIAMGSILTIFTAGARHGARAREKMEAGRVALAVFDLVDNGFTGGGRDATGSLNNETYSGGPSTILGAPDFVAKSTVLLVWKYKITSLDLADTDGVQLHQLTVTVSVDEDGDLLFDDKPVDREIRVYEAILADRRVTP